MFYVIKFLQFVSEVIGNRSIIFELVKNDFRSRYLGSYLGILWAFIQPIATILIMWFIFAVGFKAGPVNGYPFVVWLMAGLLPWNFFSESLMSATHSVVDQSYLVKKVVFKVNILPVVKILSALIVHAVFLVILMVLLALYGYTPTMHFLQLFYYLSASMALVLGLSWMTSSLVVFFRDMGQIVAMILQFGFWLTPIFWSLEMIPERYHALVKLNPVFYLIEGYRETFIFGEWIWNNPSGTLYFWGVTSIVFFLGAFIYMRLRPHFADVL